MAMAMANWWKKSTTKIFFEWKQATSAHSFCNFNLYIYITYSFENVFRRVICCLLLAFFVMPKLLFKFKFKRLSNILEHKIVNYTTIESSFIYLLCRAEFKYLCMLLSKLFACWKLTWLINNCKKIISCSLNINFCHFNFPFLKISSKIIVNWDFRNF